MIYQNYWDHARHVEIERLSFIAATMVLVAGALNVLAKDGVLLEYKFIIAASMCVFMVLGLFVLYSLRVPFLKFTMLANHIATSELKIKEYYVGDSFKANKGVRFGHMIMLIYSALSALFFCAAFYFMDLKIFDIKSSPKIFLSIALTYFFILLVVVYFLNSKAYKLKVSWNESFKKIA